MNETNKKSEVKTFSELTAIKPVVVPATSAIDPQASSKEAVNDFVNEGNPSTPIPNSRISK